MPRLERSAYPEDQCGAPAMPTHIFQLSSFKPDLLEAGWIFNLL